MSDAKTAYMCAVDYEYHTDADWFGTMVYPSVKALRSARRCVKGCGIVRVRVVLDRQISKGKH